MFFCWSWLDQNTDLYEVFFLEILSDFLGFDVRLSGLLVGVDKLMIVILFAFMKLVVGVVSTAPF